MLLLYFHLRGGITQNFFLEVENNFFLNEKLKLKFNILEKITSTTPSLSQKKESIITKNPLSRGLEIRKRKFTNSYFTVISPLTMKTFTPSHTYIFIIILSLYSSMANLAHLLLITLAITLHRIIRPMMIGKVASD
jgi:hypothetical protein